MESIRPFVAQPPARDRQLSRPWGSQRGPNAVREVEAVWYCAIMVSKKNFSESRTSGMCLGRIEGNFVGVVIGFNLQH